jgi:excinuclease ABC subunit A
MSAATTSDERIAVRGARVHNLQGVDLSLPKNKLIVFTGVSGSGKSSMAFDTIYAEGQRRYIESLSAYARQFMEQMEKPDVDQITGLPPAISIEQKAAGGNPRSTVGTMTEIYDYLRVLYARLGTVHCLECGKPIGGQTREQIIDQVMALPTGSRLNMLAPIVRNRQGEFLDLFEDLQKQGFVRARVDGAIYALTDDPGLDRHMKHDVDVVVDRIILKPDSRTRIGEAVEAALTIGNGSLIANLVESSEDAGSDIIMGTAFACSECGISYEEPIPQLFSFNVPSGMCQTCNGIGTDVQIDAGLLISDTSKSLREGALATVEVDRNKWNRHLYEGVLAKYGGKGVDLDTPWRKIPEKAQDKLLNGLDGERIKFTYKRSKREKGWTHKDSFDGLIPMLEKKYRETKDERTKEDLSDFTAQVKCTDCEGTRLRPEARAVKFGGLSLPELTAMSVEDEHKFLQTIELTDIERQIGQEALNEVTSRLEFLINVGLKYVSLDRTAPTLSGGEAQRIRLASQIGSGLVGVLYVLDEPSIGLHHRDNHRLLNALCRLRDLGNTVIVVEHDEDTMVAGDLVVDFGPGPGIQGGEIVVIGSVDEVRANPDSITGQFLSGTRQIEIPKDRRKPNGLWIEIESAHHNNLKDIDVRIPLGVFTCVTGVSGSGKSSLIADTLLPALTQHFFNSKQPIGPHGAIKGIDNIDKVIHIDQSPIGRTPRSNPSTYTKALDPIRKLYSDMPESQVRGYKQGRFSFNVKEGRCDACDGHGATRVEMDFLSDVWVPCPVCNGNRFNAETLQIEYKGKNIAEVLNMDVQEALEFFANIPPVKRILQTLHDVGLDYVKLGQPSTTLSGGEAQRIKLARELCRKSTGKTLYILDEPTTGLHFHDIDHLLEVLHRFTDDGNSVLVIEHNMDVIKTADWLIDLGPEGGDEGGRIIAEGTPEKVAKAKNSWTGQVLRQVLDTGRTGGLEPVKGISLTAEVDGALTDVYTPIERMTDIKVTGAREHNLQNVDLIIPREKLVVFSGVSGSGKTSMALDTIYAEGQRRYVESLSSYARQFLGQVQKPRVDQIEGLSPAIAIEQKSASKNPRSTIGTVTEIYDYVRVIYAQIADVYCPDCQVKAGRQSSSEVIDRLLTELVGEQAIFLAPVEPRKGEDHADTIQRAARDGYLRVRVDGEIVRIEDLGELDRRRTHTIQIVVDRITVQDDQRGRIGEAVEAAFSRGAGRLTVLVTAEDGTSREVALSQHLSCPSCGESFDLLTPQMFAFNRAHDLSASGMCPACEGMGTQQGLAEEAVIRSRSLSISDGAVSLWGRPKGQFRRMLKAAGTKLGFDIDLPIGEQSDDARNALFYGNSTEWIEVKPDGFKFQYFGLFPGIDRALRAAPTIREQLGQVLSEVPCSVCSGTRLQPQGRSARLRDVPIGVLTKWPIRETRGFFDSLDLDEHEQAVVGDVLGEIQTRLKFLDEVGLDYVSLDRRAPTLSGGETQRIRLASQIGSGLTGVLYVLDEPTIGLHPRDNKRLLGALERLRDLHNTVVVVEHDEDTLRSADHIVDFGPGAGTAGGHIVASNTPELLVADEASLTGGYLGGRLRMHIPKTRRPGNGETITVSGARHHNLKDLVIKFPLGTMSVVTGVSGSGKSSLVNDVLYRTLAAELHRAQLVPGLHDSVSGIQHVDKVILIDQEPIGNSPLSNPATYSGVFDHLRALFARMPESKARGYTARRFSTNVPGGRCERCSGYGKRHIEMHFLPDVWVECEECEGMRYNLATLEIKFRGVSIGEVLQMSVETALEHFHNVPKVRSLMQSLADVGLGYLQLGQAAPTLSGGEAQRLKLARELARPSTGQTMYILDEPTTGLHFEDVKRLLDVLNRLVKGGNTVIMIEHNLGVIQSADWILDLGPEGGDAGGHVVVSGTPEEVAACESSHTGRVLRDLLDRNPRLDLKIEVPEPEFEVLDDNADEIDLASDPDDDGTASGKPPWRVDGRAWHLSKDRLRRDHPADWDPDDVTRFIDRLQSEFEIKVTWTNQLFITIKPTKHEWGVWCRVFTDHSKEIRITVNTRRELFDEQADRSGFAPSRGKPGWMGDEWMWSERSVTSGSTIDDPSMWEYLQATYECFVSFQDKHVAEHGAESTVDVSDQSVEEEVEIVSDDLAVEETRESAWRRDGRAWHLDMTRERNNGRSPAWDPDALVSFTDQAVALGVDSIKWDNKNTVTGFVQSVGKWFEVRTTDEHSLRIRIFVPKGTFDGTALRRQLDLRPYDEVDEVPMGGKQNRVRMNGRGRDWTRINLQVALKREVISDGFRTFLTEAYEAFVHSTATAED